MKKSPIKRTSYLELTEIEKILKKFEDSTIPPKFIEELEESLAYQLQRATKSKLKAFSNRISNNLDRVFRSYLNSYHRRHKGLKGWRNIPELRGAMRRELRSRISLSLSLIKTQNDKTMNLIKSRFLGFLSSDRERPLSEFLQVSKSSKKEDRHLRFILRDQTTKMLGNFDNLIAKKYNAYGFIWENMEDHRVAGYGKSSSEKAKLDKSKTHGDHDSRGGKLYLYEDSWILKEGLIKASMLPLAKFNDGLPGQPIGCRCWAHNLYDILEIPKYLNKSAKDVFTQKGLDYIESNRPKRS